MEITASSFKLRVNAREDRKAISYQERATAVNREALALNEAPPAISLFPAGDGTRAGSLVALSDSAVHIAACKMAQSGSDLILRLFEPTGRRRTTRHTIPSLAVDETLRLDPFEIVTLRIKRRFGRVVETNLLERPLRKGTKQ